MNLAPKSSPGAPGVQGKLGGHVPLDFQFYFWSLAFPGNSRVGEQHTAKTDSPHLCSQHRAEARLSERMKQGRQWRTHLDGLSDSHLHTLNQPRLEVLQRGKGRILSIFGGRTKYLRGEGEWACGDYLPEEEVELSTRNWHVEIYPQAFDRTCWDMSLIVWAVGFILGPGNARKYHWESWKGPAWPLTMTLRSRFRKLLKETQT
jgi:hypothetical protein